MTERRQARRDVAGRDPSLPNHHLPPCLDCERSRWPDRFHLGHEGPRGGAPALASVQHAVLS